MKAFAIFVLLCGLVACTPDDTQKINAVVAQVQQVAQKGCGIVPAAVDIAVIVQQPGFAGALQLADAICKQYLAKSSIQSLTDDSCVAVIDGVCVHKE